MFGYVFPFVAGCFDRVNGYHDDFPLTKHLHKFHNIKERFSLPQYFPPMVTGFCIWNRGNNVYYQSGMHRNISKTLWYWNPYIEVPFTWPLVKGLSRFRSLNITDALTYEHVNKSVKLSHWSPSKINATRMDETVKQLGPTILNIGRGSTHEAFLKTVVAYLWRQSSYK